MRINPPKLVIDEQEPFKDALFGREELIKSLTALLRNVSENLVIFVNAPWGAGKTTFSEMWRAYLRGQKLDVIYFDAYASDYFDDPFVCFSGEILELMEKRFPDAKSMEERKEFRRTAVEIMKRVGGLAAKVGLRVATQGVVDIAHLEKIKEVGAEIVTGVSEIGADVIEKKIENYAKEKDALKSFKESLTKVALKFRGEQGFPLTIIVDELDRCRPGFALELLERIKHLFDVDNVAFVLLVNREQIESYIRTVYGEVDAQAFLLKFGTVFIDLPSQQHGELSEFYVKGHKEYCRSLVDHYGLATRTSNATLLRDCIVFFADHFKLTLREIERVFGILAVYYGALTSAGDARLMAAIALLSVLKVNRPFLYRLMLQGTISADAFFKETELNPTRGKNLGFSGEWMKNSLDCLIMSEAEYENATKIDGEATNFRPKLKEIAQTLPMERERIIPYLCSQLDRFFLTPI